MLLSVSEAIKFTGVSRATMYRYLDEGKISFAVDGRGKKTIDTAELVRVFGDSANRPEKISKDSIEQSVQIQAVLMKQENQYLRETLERLQRDLQEAKDRATKAEERLDAVLLRLQAPEQQQSDSQPITRKFFGLFR